MGRSGFLITQCSQSVGDRPNVILVLNLEQFRSVVVVGLDQKVRAGMLPSQTDPAIGCQNDTLWPFERYP